MVSRPLVLLVDDQAELAEVIAKALYERGMNVVVALDGQDALDHTRHLLPDLVITDLHMPRVHGQRLVQALRDAQDTRDVPVIVTTSISSPQLRPTMEQLGIQGFFAKPLELKAFLDTAARLAGERAKSAGV